jgi:DNA-binding phage protein
MTTNRKMEESAFGELLAEEFPSEKERLAFEREVARIVAYAELVREIEAVRAAKGASKASLGRRVDVPREVVSRFLSGKSDNPQLGTLVDTLLALDVYLEVKIRPQPKEKRFRHPALEVSASSALAA